MIFTSYLNYIEAMGTTYAMTNAMVVAKAITPAVMALLSLYVIIWGISYLRGEMREPITEAATRFAKIALILGIGLQLGHYNEIVVDTFINGPEQLGMQLTGSKGNATTAGSLDAILKTGYTVSKGFLDRGSILSGDAALYGMGFFLLIVTGAVTLYSFALIVMSKIMLFLLIALGPLFIISLLFQASAGYFTAWIHKMTNYSLLSILIIAVNVLIVSMFERSILQAGSSEQLDNVLPMIITGVLSVLALAQLTTVAAGLAGGLSMSSQGIGRLGLSALSGSARSALSLSKAGVDKVAAYRARQQAAPKKIQRPQLTFQSENRYENRDNHIGAA